MKLIYIAGPYTAHTEELIQANIDHAELASIKLLQRGWAVFTPHKNTSGYQAYEHLPGIDYNLWIKMDLEILSRCDAIFLLSTWKNSKGAKIEYEYAVENNIRQFFEELGYPDA